MSQKIHCPVCHQDTVIRAHFCMGCKSLLARTNLADSAYPAELSGDMDSDSGTFLVAAEMTCPKCSGTDSDAAGLCISCALKMLPTSRKRWSLCLEGIAGASDKGIRHPRNEDCFLIESVSNSHEKIQLGVVCDGISTSQYPDQASAEGCDVILGELLRMLELPASARPLDGMAQAIRLADAAVRHLAHAEGKYAPHQDGPETTAVAVQISGRVIQVGWLGDSRAYFIGRERVQVQLTHDHSYLAQLIDRGLTLTEALSHRGAHALTSCLGGPTNPGESCDAPSVVTFTAPENGWVILCTDGLWNYLPDPFHFATAVRQASRSTLRQMALQLVQLALKAGGKDNVTAVVMEID